MNATSGSVVDSVNVAVIKDELPVSPIPVSVTACAISPVFDTQVFLQSRLLHS